jgi:hypothetical protein
MDRLLANELANKIITGSGYYEDEDIDVFGDGVLAGGRRRMRKRRPSAFNMAVKRYMRQHGVSLAEAAHALRGTHSKKRRRRRRGGEGVGIGMYGMGGMYGGAKKSPYASLVSNSASRLAARKAAEKFAEQYMCSHPPSKKASKRELEQYYNMCNPQAPKKLSASVKKALRDLISGKVSLPPSLQQSAEDTAKAYIQHLTSEFGQGKKKNL